MISKHRPISGWPSGVALLLVAVCANTAAHAQPAPDQLGDWKAAVSCGALIDRLAAENQKGLTSLLETAGTPSPGQQQLIAGQRQNIALKRAVAAQIKARASAMLSSGYARWAAASALPPRNELEAEALRAATAQAARPSSVGELTHEIDGRNCERFLAG